MPPRDMQADADTLSIPCCLAQGLDDPAFREWAQDHPDWFVAGTWTATVQPGASARPSPVDAATTAPALTQSRTSAQARSDRADATRRIGVGTADPPPPPDPATISLADFSDVVAQAQHAAADLPASASSLDSDV